MVRWRFARALILLMVCSLPAALYAGGTEQKILTQEDVDRVLEVFPGYVQWIKESAPGLKLRGAQQNPTAWLIAGMFKKGASDYIQRQGWNFKDFAVTSGSLFQAFSHLESRPGNKGAPEPNKQEQQKKVSPLEIKRFPFVDQSLQKPPDRQESLAQQKVPAANLEMAKKNRERISVMLSTIK